MGELISDIDFIDRSAMEASETIPISVEENTGKTKKLYIESYGCQMNFSDSEIVTSILKREGFDTTSNIENADVIFINTCSIREKAEQRVRKRLQYFKVLKIKKPDLPV